MCSPNAPAGLYDFLGQPASGLASGKTQENKTKSAVFAPNQPDLVSFPTCEVKGEGQTYSRKTISQ